MKLASTIIILFTTFWAQSQENQIPINDKTGMAEYTEVITESGSASALYKQAMFWINDYFKNPTGTIQEKEEGSFIEGKSRFKVVLRDKKGSVESQSYVNYNFRIDFKDGKYKYTIYRINWQKPSYYDVSKWENKEDPAYQEEIYPEYVTQTVAFFSSFLNDLTTGVGTPLEVESSDW